MKKGGGEIGLGGFGTIYDDIGDITVKEIKNDMIQMYTSICSRVSFEAIKGSIVFKQFNEMYPDYYEEEAKNEIVRNIVKPLNLTSLHEMVKSIKISKCESVIVYQKFDDNLEHFLYNQNDSGTQQKWVRNPNIIVDPNDFISLMMSQLLNFCICIHDQGYIHSDIKLDNILVRNKYDIVLADYGLLTKMDSINDFNHENLFDRMFDYMPPFCQYNGNNSDVTTDYIKRMNCIFISSCKGSCKATKHPPVLIPDNNENEFFRKIAASYKINEVLDQSKKIKIDLHPIGIILLQVLYFFKDKIGNNTTKAFWQDIAMKLLNNNDATAKSILEMIKTNKGNTNGGGKKKVLCLGRKRVVYYQGRKQFVNVLGKRISLKEAKLLEKKLQNK